MGDDDESVSLGLCDSAVDYLTKEEYMLPGNILLMDQEPHLKMTTCDTNTTKDDMIVDDIPVTTGIAALNTKQLLASDRVSTDVITTPVLIHDTQSQCQSVCNSVAVTTNTVSSTTNSMLTQLNPQDQQFAVQNVQLQTGETVPLITTLDELKSVTDLIGGNLQTENLPTVAGTFR